MLRPFVLELLGSRVGFSLWFSCVFRVALGVAFRIGGRVGLRLPVRVGCFLVRSRWIEKVCPWRSCASSGLCHISPHLLRRGLFLYR